MSTCNGERFIAEQVRSILQQLPSDGLLMVRDDGSIDATVKRIDEFRDARITLWQGENIGFARSFLTLLMEAPADAEMVMFSDQDDVWLPQKIERAWQHMQPLAGQPALYCSAQMLVDESLHPLQITPAWPRAPSFMGALSENVVTGCTAALNQPAVALLKVAGVPEGVFFHDWWLYLVVSAFGAVVYDNQPSLLYRQHGANLIGHGAGDLGRLIRILRFLAKYDWVGIMLGQIAALNRCYGDRLDAEQQKLLGSNFVMANKIAVPRWRMLFGRESWRQTALKEILFRLLLLLYKLNVWPLPGRRL
ncbi:MAG: glycosyltransferase [Betaproteobacteria bacterium]|nr:glycosyltransferase [Betaproteobacteria bacterium]